MYGIKLVRSRRGPKLKIFGINFNLWTLILLVIFCIPSFFIVYYHKFQIVPIGKLIVSHGELTIC